MGRVQSAVREANKSRGTINHYYDMDINHVDEIYRSSPYPFDMICKAFQFGYAQGRKAARAELMHLQSNRPIAKTGSS